MKKLIFILIVGSLFIGCSVETLKRLNESVDAEGNDPLFEKTDMFGDTFNTHNTDIAIMDYERDVINSDIVYLTLYINPRIGNPFDTRKTVALKQERNKQFKRFMDKYNYKYFNVTDFSDAGGAANKLLGKRYYLYTVHFHKSEEEFDKWTKRYQN